MFTSKLVHENWNELKVCICIKYQFKIISKALKYEVCSITYVYITIICSYLSDSCFKYFYDPSSDTITKIQDFFLENRSIKYMQWVCYLCVYQIEIRTMQWRIQDLLPNASALPCRLSHKTFKQLFPFNSLQMRHPFFL